MRTLKIQPTRLDATRITQPHQSHGRFDAGPAALGLGVQGRMEQGAERLDVHRDSRRAVRLQLAARAQRERDRAAHPGSDDQRRDRPEPAPPAEPPPQPGARVAQLLQGRPWRRPRLQVWQRSLPRNVLRGVLPDVVRQPDDLLQARRRAVGSRAVRSRRDRGHADDLLVLRERHVAHQQSPDRHPRPPLRPLRQLTARAVASGGTLQRHAHHVRRR